MGIFKNLFAPKVVSIVLPRIGPIVLRIDYNNHVVSIHNSDYYDPNALSLTNGIDTVVREISRRENLDPAKYKWVYKDSEDIWDGYNPATETFISLHKATEKEAIEAILTKE